MSAEPVDLNVARMRTAVARYSDKGFRVLRVQRNEKIPLDQKWDEKATDHPKVLDEWFKDSVYNIGVACGPQPNGKNLVCIDVDTRHDGLAKWAQLVEINGIPRTAMHITPSGGLHIFLNAPFPVTNANNLPQGIDVRGVGGQVVVPPSTRIIDGDLLAYAAVNGCGLWEHDVADMPEWLYDLVRPIERSIERHPSVPRAPRPDSGEIENADWLRDHWDWVTELEKLGYRVVRHSGDDVYVAHPEATSPHSAVVHLDEGWMMAFSDNMPAPLRDRQYSTDGFVKWSPYDWFVATQHGGSYSAATSEINRRRAPLGGGGRRERAAGPAAPDQDDTGDTSSHRLPTVDPAYWSASARNAHIFAAARAALVSPDALDLVVFSLQSLLIPPSYLLPRIVGGQQPLNFLACLVAGTGMFKTSTLDAARDVMGPLPPWVLSIGMGSGEGIGAMFLKEEVKENDKGKQIPTGRLVRNDIRGVFFEADEGKSMSDSARRHGATVIANLCKAWSGSTLGEANADLAKRRHVLDRDYRVAALVNIQPSNFGLLFSEANTGTGLTGRFMFSGTLDADIPDEDTPWPGILGRPTFSDMPVELTIDASIVAEAKAEIRRRHRESGLNTALDATAQNAAVTARMAGIACLMDDRRHITTDDWHVASLRAQTSAACLSTLDSWDAARAGDESLRAAVAKMHVADAVEDIRNRQAIARLAERIRTVVAEESWAIGKLRKKITSGETRGRFDEALALAVSNGWVKVVDGRVEKA